MDPIQIAAPEEDVVQPIQISETPQAPPLPEAVAANRATKAVLGLPGIGKSYDDMFKAMLDGKEGDLRKEAAAITNMNNTVRQQQMITAIASQEGRRLTLPEVALIQDLAKKKQQDPDAVIEEGYANTFLENLRKTSAQDPDSFMAEAFKTAPKVLEKDMLTGKDYKAKRELIQTYLENANAALEQQSMGGWVLDQGKNLIPGYQYFKSADTSKGGALGINLDRQASDLFNMPYDQMKQKLALVAEQLTKDNPSTAVTFLQALLYQSQSERVLNNYFPLMDAAVIGDVAGLGAGIAGKLRAVNQAKTAIRQVSTSLEKPAGKVAMEEAVGNTKESGIQQATLNTVRQLQGKDEPAKDALTGLQSIFGRNQDLITKDAVIEIDKQGTLRTFGQELVNRIAERTSETYSKFMSLVENSMKIDRLPAVFAVETNVRKLVEGFKTLYPGLENSIMDIKFNRDALGNVFADSYLTRDGTTLFSSERTAKAFISHHQLGDAAIVEAAGPGKMLRNAKTGVEVQQQGAGFYVVKSKPVNETDALVRDLLITTNETKTPISWFNSYGGWVGSIRTPEETLALENILARKVATFGPSNWIQLIKESSQEIRQLRSWALPGTKKAQRWKEWEQVMAAAERAPKPDNELTNISFRSPGELSELYMNTVHRLPDPQEVAAAFAHRRNDEMLQGFLKIREFKRQTRLGAQTITISAIDTTKQTATKILSSSVSFSGTKMDALPKSDLVMVMGTKVGNEGFISGENLARSKKGQKMATLIEQGVLKVYKLTDAERRPLAAFGRVGDQRVQYVITENGQEKALNWMDIKTGKQARYDHEHYVGQAIVHHDDITRTKWYEGDRTIAGFNLRSISRDVAEKLDNIRKLLQSGDEVAAKAYFQTTKLPQEWSEVHGWFKYDVTAEGLPVPAKLNLDQEIRSIPRGQTIIDMDKRMQQQFEKEEVVDGLTHKDGTKQRYDNYIDNKRDPYDLFTLRNEGTKANPDYSLGNVKYIDPVTAMNRALSKAVNGMFMDDYKVLSIEHWIQEAKPHMDVSDANLASAPAYWFYQPRWKPGTDVNIVNNLMTANMQVKQFMGVTDQTTTWLHSFAQAMADKIYEKTGHESLAPAWLLPKLHDPFAFIRSMTFHAKLGLFSIPQLWVQGQTFATIYGVAGSKYATPGTKAAMLHTWSRINKNPEILAKLDEMAATHILPGTSKFKPGEWLEAHNLFVSSGFDKVAGEHIFRDSTMFYDFIGSKVDSFLNAGAFFFNEGERMTRTAAFYTAYREMRDSVPLGKLTTAQERQILQRADLLTANMSRASASSIHKGIFSIPTQFLSYQLRMSELFLGKRLAPVERMRLFGTYAALYGVPGAFGLSGAPIGPLINKWAQENGYVTGAEGNSYINSAMTEGIPALILGLTTGNWYNIGERYGNQGFDVLRDFLRSDKTFLDVIGGAPYSTISGMLAATDGFTQAMLDGIRGDGKFPVKVEDFVAPFKEISSINAGIRLYAAMNTNRWLTKKEGYMTDVSSSNAIFMTLSGLAPGETTDVVTQAWTKEDEKTAQKVGLERFIKEMHKSYTAQDQKNYTQATDYYNRAMRWLNVSGFPEDRYSEAFAIAAKDWESIINRSNWDYYLKHVPTTRQKAADEGFKKLLQTQNR